MRVVLAAAGAALLLGVAWFFFGSAETPNAKSMDAGTREAHTIPRAPAAHSTADVDPPAGERPEAQRPFREEEVEPTLDEGKSTAVDDSFAEIRGRLLFPGRTPASGVLVEIRGRGGNSERVLRYGVPEDWTDPSTETGADGRFSVRFDPPRAFQFFAEATVEGYATESWRWSEILPGSVVDLGEIELKSAGSIRGRVVNRSGEPQPGFRVTAKSPRRNDPAHQTYSEAVNVTKDAAEFLIRGMPAGTTTLQAKHPMAGYLFGPAVEVRAGDVVEADLIYDGPDIRRRIAISVSAHPIRTEGPSGDMIHLLGPGGLPQIGGNARGGATGNVFDDLPPGLYSVEIHDPRFLPWRQDNVSPGTMVSARLKGNASIQLSVVDGSSGLPVNDYALSVEFRSTRSWPNLFKLKAPEDPAPADGLHSGLVPGDYTLVCSSPDHPEAQVLVDAVQANETRPATIVLHRGSSVSGTVSSAGQPAPLATVWLLPTGEAPKRSPFGVFQFAQEVIGDESGAFRFPVVAPGSWWLQARLGSTVTSSLIPIQVNPGDEIAGVELELPPHGVIRGNVGDWLVGAEGVRVHFSRIEEPETDAVTWQRADVLAAVDGDGHFEAGPLPFGKYGSMLSLPEPRVPSAGGGYMVNGTATRPIGETIVLDQPVVDIELASTSLGGSVEITVVFDGVRAAGYTVHLRQAAEGERVADCFSSVTNDQGVARLPVVLAGDWIVRIGPPIPAWIYVDSLPIRVSVGSETRRTVEIALHEHRVTLVDGATGNALADADVQVKVDWGNCWTYVPKKTDAEGGLTLRLPLGDVTIEYQQLGKPTMEAIAHWDVGGKPIGPLALMPQGD